MTNVEIITGRVCPYCAGKPQLMDSEAIYGRSYGLIWACLSCSAWVGVHKGSERPLGRLANAELREWKKKAHAAFDPLWKKKIAQGTKRFQARTAAYEWLAGQMKLTRELCHIGMFDVRECRRVVDICQQFYQPINTTNV